ncbi:MAG: glycosyltransferase family 4 protein [Elusimicrobiota bacterium]
MRILYLLDEPYDSGLTSSALELARLLKVEGVPCGVVCRRGSFAHKRAVEDGLACFAFRGSWLISLSKITRWIMQEGWTIVHAYTGSTHTLAWFLKRRLPHLFVVRTRADARKVKRRMLYQRILKATSLMTFPTRALREEFLLIYDFPIRKARLAHPALPGMERWAEVEQARLGADQSRKGPVISMVGRLDPVKGQADLIQAMALMSGRFPGVVCQIIGRQENVKMADLKRLALRLGVEQKVEFLGRLEPKDLALAMARTDIAVIASRGSEVISRVCLEWMSLGKPLVATRVGMIRELIENGRSGILVQPQCPEEIAYAVGRLLKNPDLARSMGHEAQFRYLERLAPGPAVKEHLALYKTLVAVRGASMDRDK